MFFLQKFSFAITQIILVSVFQWIAYAVTGACLTSKFSLLIYIPKQTTIMLEKNGVISTERKK